MGHERYLRVLLHRNEDSLRELDVFVADDIQVFLHLAIFPKLVPFILFDFCNRIKNEL